MKYLIGGLALSLICLPAFAGAKFAPSEHCVAYTTKKTLALVNRVDVLGKSCSIQASAQKSGETFSALVEIPIKSLNSGEPKRDAEVPKILKAATQPNLVFSSRPLPRAEWLKLYQSGSGKLSGKLKVAGKSFNVTANVTLKKTKGGFTLAGTIPSKFSALGLQAPVVGPGGSIAKVDDTLNLHFQILSQKVKGMAAFGPLK